MPTVAQQLQQLQNDKQTLVTKLTEKGVTASNDETFTTLCPKVGDIQSGTNIEINDCSYLFYNNARTSNVYDILSICKNVTTTYNMFFGYLGSSLNLSNFDVSQVTDMQYMFAYNSLSNVNLNNFNTGNVNTMLCMFQESESLKSIDVSSFNTSNVYDMNGMFINCKKLESLDLSNFDTSNVMTNQSMFNGCSKLTKLIINNNSIFKNTSSGILSGTPIASKTGYVYVPDDLVESYKSATNWSVYASQIKGMSELPEE